MVTHFYKQKPSIPVIESSEKDDLIQVTADKLKAQSDELLLEFGQLVGTEMRQIESMTTKSHRLLRLFQQDYYEFSENLNENVRTLAEFQKDFDSIDQNFDEIEELSRKSKMMKDLVKDVMKRYDNGSLSGKKKNKSAAR